MDGLGGKIVRTDDFLWHISNVGAGVAVFVATLLYAPPGSHSLNLILFSIDPFYLLIPLSIVYIVWIGIDFWRWYSSTDNQ